MVGDVKGDTDDSAGIEVFQYFNSVACYILICIAKSIKISFPSHLSFVIAHSYFYLGQLYLFGRFSTLKNVHILFLLKIPFEIISFSKSCKNSTQNSHTSFQSLQS